MTKDQMDKSKILQSNLNEANCDLVELLCTHNKIHEYFYKKHNSIHHAITKTR